MVVNFTCFLLQNFGCGNLAWFDHRIWPSRLTINRQQNYKGRIVVFPKTGDQWVHHLTAPGFSWLGNKCQLNISIVSSKVYLIAYLIGKVKGDTPQLKVLFGSGPPISLPKLYYPPGVVWKWLRCKPSFEKESFIADHIVWGCLQWSLRKL